MKLIRIILVFLTVSLPALQGTVSVELPQPRQETRAFSQHTPTAFNYLDTLMTPVQVTPQGVALFFQHQYNTRQYAEDVLPHDLSHLITFLAHCKKVPNADYVRLILSLFSQKVEECSYLQASAFVSLAQQLPDLVGPLLAQPCSSPLEKKREVKKVLYQWFLGNFDQFKENSAQFFDDLAQDLVEKIDTTEQALAIERNRQALIRFIHNALHKVMWSPKDPLLWAHMKQIGTELSNLGQRGIITDAEDLNDLYWVLIHRIIYFIDLAQEELPQQFFQQAQFDLSQTQDAFIITPEREELVVSKQDMLAKTLATKYARTLV